MAPAGVGVGDSGAPGPRRRRRRRLARRRPVPAGRSHRRSAGLAFRLRGAVGGELVQQRGEFPCTSITVRVLASSLARRSFSRRSRAVSRSSGSAAGRPVGLPSAASAPRSRCLRHSVISELYRPSRRSRAPLPSFDNVSYSASYKVRVLAEYVLAWARSGTSASGCCSWLIPPV